ncbi:MAG: HAD hydrolase family protein [Melioribacteraceae bacterium]|nr:HAD hydrolase family protein [Melioribacteraceae bacterium]
MIISDKSIKDKIKNVKIFLFDLDGVVVIRKDENEDELIKSMEEFTEKLSKDNCYVGIVTARSDDELTKKLASIDNCKVVTASFDKVSKVEKIIKELNLEFENVLYIGDDMLDIPLLQKAGVAIAPNTVRREVKRVVDFTIDITDNGSILNSMFDLIERFK